MVIDVAMMAGKGLLRLRMNASPPSDAGGLETWAERPIEVTSFSKRRNLFLLPLFA